MEDGPGWVADADQEGQAWLTDPDDEAQGWLDDPDEAGQERYFDGDEWTSEVRPADAGVPLRHLPEHVPELQRAFAAATADIDAVEARLGLLFDRAQGTEPPPARGRKASKHKAAAAAAEAQAKAEPGTTGAQTGTAGEAPASVESLLGTKGEDGEVDEFDGFDEDNDALAELDEALASEEPEHIKRNLFRRRA
jgi:hypothetical protein